MRPPRSRSLLSRAVPFSGLAVALVAWSAGVRLAHTHIVPGPLVVLISMVHLAKSGALFKHAIASLFRVSWGYFGAVATGVPLGLWLGLSRRAERAFSPYVQLLRTISPLAWIPLAILWFGVGDAPAVFIVFIGSLAPIVVVTAHAVASIPATQLHIAANFGLSRWQTIRAVLLPAIVPELLVGLRLTLGVSWLVVVAAEMIAVNSGLGFLIIDSRNAGDRYDLVVAGMLSVGAIGLALDVAMRSLERIGAVGWAHHGHDEDVQP